MREGEGGGQCALAICSGHGCQRIGGNRGWGSLTGGEKVCKSGDFLQYKALLAMARLCWLHQPDSGAPPTGSLSRPWPRWAVLLGSLAKALNVGQRLFYLRASSTLRWGRGWANGVRGTQTDSVGQSRLGETRTLEPDEDNPLGGQALCALSCQDPRTIAGKIVLNDCKMTL